jgi:hypothetical protein
MGHQIQQKGFTLPLCAHILSTCIQSIRSAVVEHSLERTSCRNSSEWPSCTYRMYCFFSCTCSYKGTFGQVVSVSAHAKAHLGLGQVVSVPASMAWHIKSWEMLWRKSHTAYSKQNTRAMFLKLWSADHKWSSGSALVVLLHWTLVQKRQKK